MHHMCNCRIQLWDMSIFSAKKFNCCCVCYIHLSCLIYPDTLANVKLYRKKNTACRSANINWELPNSALWRSQFLPNWSHWSALRIWPGTLQLPGGLQWGSVKPEAEQATIWCLQCMFWGMAAWLFPHPRKWMPSQWSHAGDVPFYLFIFFLSFVLCTVRQFGHCRKTFSVVISWSQMSCQDAFQLQPPSLGVAVPRHTGEVLQFCCSMMKSISWFIDTMLIHIDHALFWCLHKLAHLQEHQRVLRNLAFNFSVAGLAVHSSWQRRWARRGCLPEFLKEHDVTILGRTWYKHHHFISF